MQVEVTLKKRAQKSVGVVETEGEQVITKEESNREGGRSCENRLEN